MRLTRTHIGSLSGPTSFQSGGEMMEERRWMKTDIRKTPKKAHTPNFTFIRFVHSCFAFLLILAASLSLFHSIFFDSLLPFYLFSFGTRWNDIKQTNRNGILHIQFMTCDSFNIRISVSLFCKVVSNICTRVLACVALVALCSFFSSISAIHS